MSCMIVNENTTAAIAANLETIMNGGFSYNGFSAPESLHKALGAAGCADLYGFFTGSRIYETLCRLNSRAYAGRYHKPELLTVPDYRPGEFTLHLAEWESDHWIVKPEHYRLLKAVECLHYQLSEDATKSDPVTQALGDLVQTLMRFIVHNSPYYTDAPLD